MLLYYIRHGDPIYNPDSLTEKGEAQAQALSKRLCLTGLDKIYASTSNRAYQTALPTANALGLEVERVDFANESHAHKYFAVPCEDGKRRWAFGQKKFKDLFISKEVYALGDEWYTHPELCGCGFGDGVNFFTREIDGFMRMLGYEHDRDTHTYRSLRENNDKVALFAHEGMGGIFLSLLLDIPYPLFVTHTQLGHTGVCVIEFDPKGDEIIPRMLQFSNDSHLYKEGIPTMHYNRILI